MSEISNKELIEKLVKYFKEYADFETLARALANQMIDIQRFMNLDKLPTKELQSLWFRSQKNAEMLDDFIENGSKIKFHLVNLNISGE